MGDTTIDEERVAPALPFFAARYAFMGQNLNAADNLWLRDAFESQVPIIYFLGIALGRYKAMFPVFVLGWDALTLKARVAFGVPDQQTLSPPENVLERRYALRTVKQRLQSCCSGTGSDNSSYVRRRRIFRLISAASTVDS